MQIEIDQIPAYVQNAKSVLGNFLDSFCFFKSYFSEENFAWGVKVFY